MKVLLLLGMLMSCQGTNTQAINYLLNPDEFEKFRKEVPASILVDVRTDAEVAKGVIEGARQINYNSSDFERELEKLDKKKVYLVYCAVGGRSGRAARLMNDRGFKEVYDLKGGITAWKKEGKSLAQLK